MQRVASESCQTPQAQLRPRAINNAAGNGQPVAAVSSYCACQATPMGRQGAWREEGGAAMTLRRKDGSCAPPPAALRGFRPPSRVHTPPLLLRRAARRVPAPAGVRPGICHFEVGPALCLRLCCRLFVSPVATPRGSQAACSHPGHVEHCKGEQSVVRRLPPRVSGRVRPVRCARVRCEVRQSRDRLAGGDARLPLGAVQVGLQPAQQGRDLGLVAAADLANLACGAAARSWACAACGRTYECHKYAICDMK